jgi:alpha-methylacyl-CoA racemase
MAGVFGQLNVLEFSRVAPGSFAAMMLGDLGARVIKVESLPGVEVAGSGVSPRTASMRALATNPVNRSKHSVSMDLKSPASRPVLDRLVERADVVIEGFRPGVMDRLGLGYARLAGLNPRLVYCSLSSYGHDGPYQNYAGHDLNYLAMSGVLATLPRENPAEPAVPPLNLVSDLGAAAMHALSAILAALLERSADGAGQFIDLSYLDTTLALFSATSAYRTYAASGGPPANDGFFWGRHPFYRTYPTSDGKHISIACTEPVLWRRLCAALDREDLVPAGPRAADRVEPPSAVQEAASKELEGIFGSRARDDWFELLAPRGIGVGKVYELPELAADPQLRARGALADWIAEDGQAYPQVAPGLRLSRTPSAIRRRAPLLGEHTAEILGWAGIGQAELRVLEDDATVFVNPDRPTS